MLQRAASFGLPSAPEIGVRPYLRLGKQARDDGAADSDNVLGDVVEALIGALFHEALRRLVGAFEARAKQLYGEPGSVNAR